MLLLFLVCFYSISVSLLEQAKSCVTSPMLLKWHLKAFPEDCNKLTWVYIWNGIFSKHMLWYVMVSCPQATVSHSVCYYIGYVIQIAYLHIPKQTHLKDHQEDKKKQQHCTTDNIYQTTLKLASGNSASDSTCGKTFGQSQTETPGRNPSKRKQCYMSSTSVMLQRKINNGQPTTTSTTHVYIAPESWRLWEKCRSGNSVTQPNHNHTAFYNRSTVLLWIADQNWALLWASE